METPTPLTDEQIRAVEAVIDEMPPGDVWLHFARAIEAANNKQWLYMLAVQPDRVRECAQRLVEHADFRLGGVLSAESKPRDIPSRAYSQVKARHLAASRDALAHPPVQPVQDKDAEIAKLLEDICAAIKAEDDYCVTHGDYMLDSDDCIAVVRGTWKRPDFAIDAARSKQ